MRRRRPPVAVAVPAALAAAFFVVPLAGLMHRAPWSDAWSYVTSPTVRTALRLSMITSISAVAASFVLGLPLAMLLARHSFPGRRVLRALVTLPLILPPVVGGLALLYGLGRRGLVTGWLDRALGVSIPFTTTAAVLAATFVAMPFFVISAEAGIRSMDERYEEAAATLGAGRWTIFRRVTLPLLAPSLAAGAVLTWARALGEFGATIIFAGNNRTRTRTMPLAVFQAFEESPGAAAMLSLILLGISLTVLLLLRDRWLTTA